MLLLLGLDSLPATGYSIRLTTVLSIPWQSYRHRKHFSHSPFFTTDGGLGVRSANFRRTESCMRAFFVYEPVNPQAITLGWTATLAV
jgi:hypothetical protein